MYSNDHLLKKIRQKKSFKNLAFIKHSKFYIRVRIKSRKLCIGHLN